MAIRGSGGDSGLNNEGGRDRRGWISGSSGGRGLEVGLNTKTSVSGLTRVLEGRRTRVNASACEIVNTLLGVTGRSMASRGRGGVGVWWFGGVGGDDAGKLRDHRRRRVVVPGCRITPAVFPSSSLLAC